MDIFAAVKNRREITQFKPTPVPQDHLRELMEVGYFSVTGNNLPSRELILVEEREKLDQLSQATPFMPWLTQVPAAIVIIGNPEESKYWLQDATIATSNIWLAATALDLGGAWGAIHHSEDEEECRRREQIVRDTLDIPQTYRPVSILGLGYPAAPPKEKKLIPIEQVSHRGRFGQRISDFGDI